MALRKRPIRSAFSLAVFVAITLAPASVTNAALDDTATEYEARETIDLAPGLTANGTFAGSPYLSGTVDASQWRMVSDFAVGEPPRFKPATEPHGPDALAWSALGSVEAGALNGNVSALVVSGSDLYVGGTFTNAAGIAAADYVARWDGIAWSALGSNGAGNGALSAGVHALAVSGSELYVGGSFTNAAGIQEADYVARWDGNAWSALGEDSDGDGALNGVVSSLAGAGGDVYVGGIFTNAAGIATADYVARWDGGTWSALGSNGAGNGALSNGVAALAASGSDLYVGGYFTNVAGIATADYVARWDGSTWSALGSNGSGNGALMDYVLALAVSGSDVYVGGFFTNAAGIATADYVARWDGSTWHALGSNGAGNGALNDVVWLLSVSGGDLHVGGDFTNASGIATADYLALWKDSAWSSLGSNGAGDGALNGRVIALTVAGSDLYVGGWFTDASGVVTADHVALWNSSSWVALGSGDADVGALNHRVEALAVSGSDLYVGGLFTDAAGIATADYVARWDGSTWSALGSDGSGNGAISAAVYALAVSGSDLYVGGLFTDAAGIATADYVARWDGSTWSALGSDGSGNGALIERVFALAASGSDLYVGGAFSNAAGIPTADYVARWDGSTWNALGSNGVDDGAILGFVNALAASGSDVYVGGSFTNAAGIPTADYLARWNGSTWSALGSSGGSAGALNSAAMALAVSDGELYVGGHFTNAGAIATADYVARWDGSAWSALGSDGAGNGALNTYVGALAASGSDVYVGGFFTNVAGIPTADRIAHWNGTAWSELGSNGAGTDGALHDWVLALAESASGLYVGGAFTGAAEIPEADYIARYGPSALPPCTTPPFSDVAADHPFCSEITWMATEGISTGFDDGTYRPDIAVSRQAMSAFMARLELGPDGAAALPVCVEAPFSDVAADHPFCREITWMAQEGISTGFDDGTYRPDIAVSRQAMSAFMARLALGTAGAAALADCAEPPFSDVPVEQPFCSEIAWMATEGISTGFDDGTYRPDIAVSRQAMSAFMYRVSWLLD